MRFLGVALPRVLGRPPWEDDGTRSQGFRYAEAAPTSECRVWISAAFAFATVVARAFEPLSKAVVKQIAELGVTKIRVVDTAIDDGIVIKCLKKDPTKNEGKAALDENTMRALGLTMPAPR